MRRLRSLVPSRGARRRTLVTLCGVAVLDAGATLAVRAPASAARADGLTFTWQMRGSANRREAKSGDKGATPVNMTSTVRILGANSRMDMQEGPTPLVGPGGYILIRGAEKRILFVNPKEKTAMAFDAENFGAGFGAMTNNAMVKMTMKDNRFAFEDLGPGERVLGYPTRHVRVMTASTTEMRILGKHSWSRDSTVMDAMIATRIPGVDEAALRGFSRSFGMGMRRTNPDLAAQMLDYDRKFGAGLALRSRGVVYTTDDKGRAAVDSTTIEVTSLSKAAIDPALLELPKDYQVMDLGQAMSAAADSIRKADSASGKESRPSAGDVVKGALGGMFGRRKKP